MDNKNSSMSNINDLLKSINQKSNKVNFYHIFNSLKGNNISKKILFAVVYDKVKNKTIIHYSIIKLPLKKSSNNSFNRNLNCTFENYKNELNTFFQKNIIKKKWTIFPSKCNSNYTDIDNNRCILTASLSEKKYNYLELIPNIIPIVNPNIKNSKLINSKKNINNPNIKYGDIIFTLQQTDVNDSFIWYKFENDSSFLKNLISYSKIYFSTNTISNRGSTITGSNTGSNTKSNTGSNTESNTGSIRGSNRGSRSSNGGTKKLICSKKPKSLKINSHKKPVKKNTKK